MKMAVSFKTKVVIQFSIDSTFKCLSLTYNSLQHSQSRYLRKPFTIQQVPSTRSSFVLTLSRPLPRSLLISSSPSEPYPTLHHVSGTIYHLNSALFRFL